MNLKYRLEVNREKLKNAYYKYRLFKYDDTGKIFHEIFKENSKVKLYMKLDLLGIRDNMKFNRFYRFAGMKYGRIMFAEFIFL